MDYLAINQLKNHLLELLTSWKSKDGFFRSAPNVNGPPSFTNTGIALQAMLISGNKNEAYQLGEQLVRFLAKHNDVAFPNEKATSESNSPHVMCNYWVVQGILDCNPLWYREILSVCEWVMETQNEHGGWDLSPGEKTDYPIFTACAVMILSKFHSLLCQFGDSNKIDIGKLEKIIRSGVHNLFDGAIANFNPNNIVLVWPASLQNGTAVVNFGTTMFCIDAIVTSGQTLKNDDWVDKAEQSLVYLLENFSTEAGHFQMDRNDVSLWDQIHVNESGLNYFFGYFAPYSIFVFNKLIDRIVERKKHDLVRYISHLNEWIIQNTKRTNQAIFGVPGSAGIQEVKVWSTGLSILTLDSISRNYILLTSFSDEENNLLKEQLRVKENQLANIGRYLQFWQDENSTSKRIYWIIIFLSVVLFAGFMFRPIATHWDFLEGPIWLGTVSLTLFFAFVTDRKLLNKFISKKIRIFSKKMSIFINSSKILSKIENLLEE